LCEVRGISGIPEWHIFVTPWFLGIQFTRFNVINVINWMQFRKQFSATFLYDCKKNKIMKRKSRFWICGDSWSESSELRGKQLIKLMTKSAKQVRISRPADESRLQSLSDSKHWRIPSTNSMTTGCNGAVSRSAQLKYHHVPSLAIPLPYSLF